MVKVVENIKKKEVPKFDPEKAHQQDILELKGRVPKLTKEQSIKISLADFTLKTTLGRGGYGKVKIKQLLQGVTGLTGTLFLRVNQSYTSMNFYLRELLVGSVSLISFWC